MRRVSQNSHRRTGRKNSQLSGNEKLSIPLFCFLILYMVIRNSYIVSFCSAGGTRTRNCIFAPYTRLIPLSREPLPIPPKTLMANFSPQFLPPYGARPRTRTACGECLTLFSYIRSMILVFTIPSNLMSLRPCLMCSCMRRLASVMSLAQTRL